MLYIKSMHYVYVYICIDDNGTCDRPIVPSNQNQYIVWGIGSLGETAFQHHTRAASKLVESAINHEFFVCDPMTFVYGLCDFSGLHGNQTHPQTQA